VKKCVLFIFILLPCFAYSEDISLNFGVTDFSLDTKIMDNGSISSVSLSLNYSNDLSGTLRGQFVKTSKNEEIDDSTVSDSLIATKETVYEFFLLPIQFKFSVNQNFQWLAGIGLHYEYQNSSQKGYIDMSDLELLGFSRVNSYTDDFSMHLFGPLIDVGARYNTDLVKINFSGGVVPVYFFTTGEKQKMFPLFDTVNHSQNTWGSPYFYLGLESVLFKYAGLSVKYDYAKFEYEVIDLDYNDKESKFFPIFPKSTVISQSLMLEATALIPLGGIGFQIGYGYMLNFYTLDSSNPVTERKHYFILAGKKTSR